MTEPSQSGQPRGELMLCATANLKPHPAFTKLGLSCETRKLSALAAQRDSVFADPIVISQIFEIVAGFELWRLATLDRRPQVLCLQFEMDGEESLLRLIRSHQRSAGFNDFTRILLALELEPWFRQQAKMNQTHGGKLKGSSNLTEAQLVDVRGQVAKAACVSTGNVSSVKKILAAGIPEIIQALKRREITIHRAAKWMGLEAAAQRRVYREFELDRGAQALVRALLAKHSRKGKAIESGIERLRQLLPSLEADPKVCRFVPQIEQLLIDMTENSASGSEDRLC